MTDTGETLDRIITDPASFEKSFYELPHTARTNLLEALRLQVAHRGGISADHRFYARKTTDAAVAALTEAIEC